MSLQRQIKELKTFGCSFIYHGSSIFFRDLVNTRSLIWGNVFCMEFLWFVYSLQIQYELDRVKEVWNHNIRKSNHTNVYGIPDELYLFHESRGYVQYGKKTDPEVNDILHYRDLHT